MKSGTYHFVYIGIHLIGLLSQSDRHGVTLYRLFQFFWIHAHVPEGCNAEGIARNIIDDLVIVVDNGSAITYLSVG